MDPPVFSEFIPALNEIRPPVPESPLPLLILISPAIAFPVCMDIDPDLSFLDEPVLISIRPLDPISPELALL